MKTNATTQYVTLTACGFGDLLQIAFIILKLCNVIDWSWFWVLFPLILTFGLFALLWIGLGIFFLISHIKNKREITKDLRRPYTTPKQPRSAAAINAAANATTGSTAANPDDPDDITTTMKEDRSLYD